MRGVKGGLVVFEIVGDFGASCAGMNEVGRCFCDVSDQRPSVILRRIS